MARADPVDDGCIASATRTDSKRRITASSYTPSDRAGGVTSLILAF